MPVRKIFAAFALAFVAASSASATETLVAGGPYSPNGPYIMRDGGGLFGPGGVGACLTTGCPLSITITSQQMSSISDVPISTLFDGWTGDVLFANLTAAPGTIACTGAYLANCAITTMPLWTSVTAMPNFTSPAISIPVSSPGYTSGGVATTVSRTVSATAPMRSAYPNTSIAGSAGVVNAITGGASAAFAFSDFIFENDNVSPATVSPGVYNPGGSASLGAPNVPVTNLSTRIYPHPIGAWVTEPGLRFDGTGNFTVEFFGAQAYGKGNVPLASVKIWMEDGVCTDIGSSPTCPFKLISTLTASKRQYSTSCAATNGSNILQNCGSVAGFKIGQRLNVPGIPGQPVIGAIDTSSGGKCTTAPCLELYVRMTGTPRADGALVIGSLPAAGFALADGGFVGQRIEEPSGNGYLTSTSVKIVAPSATCGAGCGGAGSTITLPTPTQGQWATGMYLYDASAAPCVPTDVYSQVSEYIATFVSGGASTLAYNSINGGCNGHTLTAPAIAANPATNGSTTVTSITVSTTATTGTATSDTFQFDHDYQGVTGTVTVTAGAPIPVYAATFTPADFATLTTPVSGAAPTPIWFRSIAYPVVGDQPLDTQSPNTQGLTTISSASWLSGASTIGVASCAGIQTMLTQSNGTLNVYDATSSTQIGLATACAGNTLTMSSTVAGGGQFDRLQMGPNTNCDWWFFNSGSSYATGVCNPSNAAWFPVNGRVVSPNLHNLPAYYDPRNSYSPVYVWVNSAGTCTTTACVNTGTTAPGAASGYYASITTAQTSLKAYNNSAARNFAHNDINGGVFVLTDTTAYAGYGVALTNSAWAPPPTFESGAYLSGSAAAPGQVSAIAMSAGVPVVQMTGAASLAQVANNVRFQNISFVGSSNNGPLGASDAGSISAFPLSFFVLDNVILTGASTGYLVQYLGASYSYNILDNEGGATTHLLREIGDRGVPASVVGSTLICGGATNAAPKTAWAIFTAMGNISWGCPVIGVTTPPPPSGTQQWPLGTVIGYNKFMGLAGTADFAPSSTVTPTYGMLLTHNVSEVTNARATGMHALILSGDSYALPASNVFINNSTFDGGRFSIDYVEGGSFAAAAYFSYSATAGSLSSANSYYVEPAMSRASAGYVAPTSVDAVNVGGTQYFGLGTPTNNYSVKSILPCDFGYTYTLFLDTSTTITHIADVAQVTASASGTSLVVTAIAAGTLYPGSQIANGSNTGAHITSCPGGNCATTGTYGLSAPMSFSSSTKYLKATNLGACQIVYLLGPDTVESNTPPTLSNSFPARNFLKQNWYLKQNQMVEFDTKSDWSGAIAPPNGGRSGNWEIRFGAGLSSNAYLTVPYSGNYFNYNGQGGETVPQNTFYNPRCTVSHYCDQSGVRYLVGDNRSTGGGDTNNTATRVYPALDIGEGDYCPAPSATVSAGASWSAGATTINMASPNTGIVIATMGVYDATSGTFIGRVSSYSGSVLTLDAGALAASSGSSDSLQFGALIGKTRPGEAMWPWDITGVPWGAGYNNGGAFAMGCR